jgi:hypothetical protein
MKTRKIISAVIVVLLVLLVTAPVTHSPSKPEQVTSFTEPSPVPTFAPVVVNTPKASRTRTLVVTKPQVKIIKKTSTPRPVSHHHLVSGTDMWDRVSKCESGNNPRSVSSTGKFRGAFQFSLATWHEIGYKGDPIDYSYEYQKSAAKKLYAQSGRGQWPECGRYLP